MYINVTTSFTDGIGKKKDENGWKTGRGRQSRKAKKGNPVFVQILVVVI